MKLTIGELVNGSTALQILSAQQLPGTLALKLARITRQLGPELQAYNDARIAVYKKYGDISEDKAQYKLREGADTDAANAELKALWESEVPVTFNPLPETALEHIEISAELINAAQWLFEEE